MRASVGALADRLGALRHTLSERKARSGPKGIAGAGVVAPALAGVQLAEDELLEFESLVSEAEDVVQPGARARAGAALPPLPPLGEVVALLERIFDAEHGVLDVHPQVATWLSALLAAE
jgi:hypothetical protein